MEQYETLLQRLQCYCAGNAAAMHMPGHKRNAPGIAFLEALGAKYDITEIDGFDDLHHPSGILAKSMDRASELWNSEKSFFLVNGSTCGILAAVRACERLCGKGKLIMARNCHMSVYNAAELCGLEPIYITPEEVPEFGFCGSISPSSVERAVTENPGSPVIITSPTYEGVLSNIAEIAIVCHMHGSLLIVDEAHGAHLDLSKYFTGSAVTAGADIVVQSLHKTLTGLTQTAILHVSGGLIPSDYIQRELAIFQSSSPSYLLMASIDGTVDLLIRRGSELFRSWNERLYRFDEAVWGLKNLRIPGHSELFDCQRESPRAGFVRRSVGGSAVYGFDKSKLIISCEGTDLSGVELMKRLRRDFEIECEMSAGGYALAMTGILDSSENLMRLADAVLAIDSQTKKTNPRLPYRLPPLPPQRMSTKAALCRTPKSVFVKDARGLVSAEYVWAYPPGVPLIVPGEEITAEMVSSILHLRESGVELHSLCGGMPKSINVVG